ncbi:ubiquitin carboxyl-terminal hydrolase [Verticillium alfalfae VaMs.102]|uniref:ubiquitinyl hydrolase 1 n=1 Tax=Verticillium alfalfae (strain VaMs.102 / ATCC MYA-4576 / FGSC 10136) TaxID=526221 RepID=C9SXW0_VERA1|nr:ubiquitin carboxyl-terminal hydrolase [Verticillium alfalfae VaMs.102]EEY23625.1 ubiquitin carboxyl-terminal hydrolase [Verticillium alfalfae VaMs.102]
MAKPYVEGSLLPRLAGSRIITLIIGLITARCKQLPTFMYPIDEWHNVEKSVVLLTIPSRLQSPCPYPHTPTLMSLVTKPTRRALGRTDMADPHDDSAIDVSEGPITTKSPATVADEPDELITVTPLSTPAVSSVVKSKGKRKRALLPDTDYDATDELAIMDDTKGPKRNPKRKATEAVVTRYRSSEDTLKEALAPVTTEDIHQWTGWCELESEPAFFNAILRDCGVKDVKIQELFSLDEDSLQLLPQPVYGLIFLYQYFAQDCEVDDEQGQDDGIWFANQVAFPPPSYLYVVSPPDRQQTTDNACATVAMMNIVMNSDVVLGPELQAFRDATKDMCFALRGHALSQNAHIRTIHNSLTRKMDHLNADLCLSNSAAPFRKTPRSAPRPPPPHHDAQEEKEQPAATATPRRKKKTKVDSDSGFHFIAIVPRHGAVWELDGLKNGPVRLGPMDDDADWVAAGTPVSSRTACATSAEDSVTST